MISTTLLSQIVTTNLVTVTLAETQLDLNFQIILKALRAHDSALSGWGNRIDGLEKSVSQLFLRSKQIEDFSTKNIEKVGQSLVGVEKDIASIHLKLGQIIASPNPELNAQKDDVEFLNTLKYLEQKIGKIEKKVDIIEKETMKISQLQKKLQEQEDRITKLEEDYSKLRGKIQKIDQNSIKADKSELSIRDINQLLSELEKRLINELSKTKSEINITTNHLQQQVLQITNNVTPIILNFKLIAEELTRNNKQISNDIWKLNDDLYKHQAQDHSSSENPLLQSRLTQLQIKLNGHIKDHSLIQTRIYSGYKPQMSARVQASSCQKEDNKYLNQKEENKLSNQKEQNKVQEKQDPVIIKKEIIDKLKQQKGDFTKALKKLDIITVKKQQDKFKTNSFEDKLLKLEHLILGKVDQENLKKWMKNIENKIAYLYRIVNIEANEEDARIARKGWNCLSCDKKLDAYQGKVGTHIVSAVLKSKGIDAQVIGGGMLFKNHSRVELPQFKREK